MIFNSQVISVIRILKEIFPFKFVLMLSLIVAIAENNAIGKNNQLLWHLPGDLKYFKQVTRGHPVIMGRNTWFSLPRRPLPDRRNIVITDRPDETLELCETVHSVNQAITLCDPAEETFIIGGASVYRQLLPFANRLYITRVHCTFEADVFFPEIDSELWERISAGEIQHDPASGLHYTFEVYSRK